MIIKTDEEEFEVVLYTSEWGFLQNMSQKAETVRPHQASLFIDNAISDAMGYRGKYHG
jgi:hypothetical protein